MQLELLLQPQPNEQKLGRGSPGSRKSAAPLQQSLEVQVLPKRSLDKPLPNRRHQPAASPLGKRFGNLFVSRANGDEWECFCSCGATHTATLADLDRGFVAGCPLAGNDDNTVRHTAKPQRQKRHRLSKRQVITDRLAREGYIEQARLMAAQSRKPGGRTSNRVNMHKLDRALWPGIRCDNLTLIEDLGELRFWVCYCDACKRLCVRNEQIFLASVAGNCGCNRGKHKP